MCKKDVKMFFSSRCVTFLTVVVCGELGLVLLWFLLTHGSVSFFILILLQRNDKREVDNTQKIYLIDTALGKLVACYGWLMHCSSLLKRQIHNKENKTTLTLFWNTELFHAWIETYQQIRIVFLSNLLLN